MLELVAASVGAVLMILGALFGVLAAIGVLRLPDLYTRMHAASKAGAVGGGLLLLAVAVFSGAAPIVMRSILGILFLLLTTPISAHLLSRAALKAGQQPVSETRPDEMPR